MTYNSTISNTQPVLLEAVRQPRPERTYHSAVGYRRVNGRPFTLHALDQEWDGYVSLVIGSVMIDTDGSCTFHELLVLDEVMWFRTAAERVVELGNRLVGSLFVYERADTDDNGDPSRMIVWAE